MRYPRVSARVIVDGFSALEMNVCIMDYDTGKLSVRVQIGRRFG